MKKLIGFTILILCLHLTSSAQTASNPSLTDFEWLIGKWERVNNKPGQITYESWTKKSATAFLGLGWTMKGNDTVFIEKLNLVIKDGNVYYVADVSENAAPVLFQITEHSEKSFVSANPDHDFPKKITYKIDDGEILTAVISGNGKEIPYRFKKIK